LRKGAGVHRNVLVSLAAQQPAVYFERYFVTAGGLISYGPSVLEQHRHAAGYVDRGEKPAELPVQAPTKYELVVNLQTAKALGLDVPPTLLARARRRSPPRPRCVLQQPARANCHPGRAPHGSGNVYGA
jgi:putative ABC transport system substrate-binding protein